jgi:hypothetical protein
MGSFTRQNENCWPGRGSLAEIGARLGRKALAQVTTLVKPETFALPNPIFCQPEQDDIAFTRVQSERG